MKIGLSTFPVFYSPFLPSLISQSHAFPGCSGVSYKAPWEYYYIILPKNPKTQSTSKSLSKLFPVEKGGGCLNILVDLCT